MAFTQRVQALGLTLFGTKVSDSNSYFSWLFEIRINEEEHEQKIP